MSECLSSLYRYIQHHFTNTARLSRCVLKHCTTFAQSYNGHRFHTSFPYIATRYHCVSISPLRSQNHPTRHAGSPLQCSKQHNPYLHLDVEDGAELVDVGLAAGAAKDTLAGEGVELGNVPTEDLVAAGQPGIGCDDGIVWAGDGQGGAAVEIIR